MGEGAILDPFTNADPLGGLRSRTAALEAQLGGAVIPRVIPSHPVPGVPRAPDSFWAIRAIDASFTTLWEGWTPTIPARGFFTYWYTETTAATEMDIRVRITFQGVTVTSTTRRIPAGVGSNVVRLRWLHNFPGIWAKDAAGARVEYQAFRSSGAGNCWVYLPNSAWYDGITATVEGRWTGVGTTL